MVFEDLVTTTKAMQDLQKRIVYKQNKERQETADNRYRVLLMKAKGLVDVVSFLYTNTSITKDDELITSIQSLMDDLETIVETGLASFEGVINAEKKFETVNNTIKDDWPTQFVSLTGSTISTLDVIRDISPENVLQCLDKINSAKSWDLDVKKYKKMNDGLKDADQLIIGLGLDDEILSFLQNTNSGKATLVDLNEKVVSWIRDEGLENRIRISFVRTK